MFNVTAPPAYCAIHQHNKWCKHNGGVMSSSGYVHPSIRIRRITTHNMRITILRSTRNRLVSVKHGRHAKTPAR